MAFIGIVIYIWLSYYIHPALPVFFIGIALCSILVLIIDKSKKRKESMKLKQECTEIIPFYDFDVIEPDTDIDYYVPDYIEVVNSDDLYKAESKRMRYEMKLSNANNDIEHLVPKLKQVQARIKEIETERKWRTAKGHYTDTDTKVLKEIERLKDKEYSISKALSKAEFNKMDAEMYLAQYGE